MKLCDGAAAYCVLVARDQTPTGCEHALRLGHLATSSMTFFYYSLGPDIQHAYLSLTSKLMTHCCSCNNRICCRVMHIGGCVPYRPRTVSKLTARPPASTHPCRTMRFPCSCLVSVGWFALPWGEARWERPLRWRLIPSLLWVVGGVELCMAWSKVASGVSVLLLLRGATAYRECVHVFAHAFKKLLIVFVRCSLHAASVNLA